MVALGAVVALHDLLAASAATAQVLMEVVFLLHLSPCEICTGEADNISLSRIDRVEHMANLVSLKSVLRCNR